MAATYAYDPLGRRASKSGTGLAPEVYLSDGVEEIADYDGAGGLLRRYVHGPGIDEPLLMTVHDGAGAETGRQYYHADHLGSVVAMSDTLGAIADIYTYSAWGEVNDASGNPFRFTGRRLDAETGLYYYRARYYSSAIGRFLQTDPVGYGDNMNMYAYVNNDPVNGKDPSGAFGQCAEGGCNLPPLKEQLATLVELAVDFTPVIGDIKGIAEAIEDPTVINVAAAVVGLVPGVGDLAGKGLKTLNKTCSFVPGTLVLTDHGFLSIEDISVGDLVWAEDPVSGLQALKMIEEVITSDDRPVLELWLQKEGAEKSLHLVTGNHPYWVEDHGWTHALDLKPGMVVDTKDGAGAVVLSVEPRGATSRTHNLEVADLHTYFVGDHNVLVHNACKKGGNKGKKATDSGKNEPHGSGGRATEKANKQIANLEKQMQGQPKKVRKQIRQKIKNIRDTAAKKEKGATDSVREKR